jgi:hypothetical protein
MPGKRASKCNILNLVVSVFPYLIPPPTRIISLTISELHIHRSVNVTHGQISFYAALYEERVLQTVDDIYMIRRVVPQTDCLSVISHCEALTEIVLA